MARSFVLPPTDTVTFGPGAIDTIGDAVDHVGGTRAIAIVSSSLAGGPVEETLRERLGPRLAAVFAKTGQHVPRSSVLEALALARSSGADCVVSLGGGTPVDCAKAVALGLATGVTEPADFERHRVRFTYPDTYEIPPLEGDVVPHIAIPTTLSGGEHTGLCGVTDETTHEKQSFKNRKLQPAMVVLDPWVSAGTPGWLWAASGLRAVDHAVERILSTQHLAITDALSVSALQLLSANLAVSARRPDDAEARTRCFLGAWMSIFSAANVGVGLSHGIGHQLAATFDLVHGDTSAIMLPRVMDFVRGQTAPRQRIVAEALGVDTRGLDDDHAARSASDAVRALVRSCGLPERISARASRAELLAGIADRIMRDPAVATCPREVTRADVVELLRAAW